MWIYLFITYSEFHILFLASSLKDSNLGTCKCFFKITYSRIIIELEKQELHKKSSIHYILTIIIGCPLTGTVMGKKKDAMVSNGDWQGKVIRLGF